MAAPKPWELGKAWAERDEPKPEPAPPPPKYSEELKMTDEGFYSEHGHYNEAFPAELEGMPTKRIQPPEDTPFEEMAHSTYAEQLRRRNERAYRPNEIAFREMFVREFVKDWHQTRAAIRAGVKPSTASAKAAALMQEEYVLRRIYDFIESVDEETLLTRKKVIVGLMNEANDFAMGSSHGARVNAWKTLGKYMGMEITRVEGEVTHKGNVMVIPSSPTGDTFDAESWEEAASQAQQELKKVVRE